MRQRPDEYGSLPVITGLGPVIHLLRKNFMRSMDTRVKPAYDEALRHWSHLLKL
jgi:hypothetical protein